MIEEIEQVEQEEQPRNILVQEGRVGKLRISRYMFDNANADDLMRLMGHFLIVRAEYMFYRDEIEYIAYSPLFGVTDPGEEAPEYLIECDQNGPIRAVKL